MFFIIIYTGIGIYFWLMSLKIIHKNYMKDWNRFRILALRIMGTGFFILGLYYAWLYYFLSTPEGKAIQELQRKMQKEYWNHKENKSK